ncbi:MAG: hypothetical protein QM638_01185 [Nocardioides sp.]|uniref:hypothetical protein n=1 Tax=Nocardioides sp. TaxID=35761 RepID=UPI0039E2B20A
MAAQWWVGYWPSDPTSDRAWRRLRDQVVAEEPVCWLGFAGICTHVSTTADHVIPKTQRPDLAMTRANLRGCCGPCNLARGRTPVQRLSFAAGDPGDPGAFGSPDSAAGAAPSALAIFD